MPSWGNKDANTSAPKWATAQVNLRPTQANANSLFDNTTANNWAVTLADGSTRQGNLTVGLFGVDQQEQQAYQNTTNPHAPHAGWVLRTVGQGGRAGRVMHETLVTLKITPPDADGQVFPNVSIVLALSGNQTVYSNASFANVATFIATPTLSGNTNATLTYQWQYNNASGSYGWANIPANTSSIHFAGATSNTLYAMPGSTANNTNVFRVVVNAADEGVTATSSNVSISIPA
jgi:hypothetical protein